MKNLPDTGYCFGRLQQQSGNILDAVIIVCFLNFLIISERLYFKTLI